VPTATEVVSWISSRGEVYSIQHYVMKFVSDLRQVGGFLEVLRFLPPIKLSATIRSTNGAHDYMYLSINGSPGRVEQILSQSFVQD